MDRDIVHYADAESSIRNFYDAARILTKAHNPVVHLPRDGVRPTSLSVQAAA